MTHYLTILAHPSTRLHLTWSTKPLNYNAVYMYVSEALMPTELHDPGHGTSAHTITTRMEKLYGLSLQVSNV